MMRSTPPPAATTHAAAPPAPESVNNPAEVDQEQAAADVSVKAPDDETTDVAAPVIDKVLPSPEICSVSVSLK